MSEKSQPKFDKDIELAKINFVAEEWRNAQLWQLGVLASAMIAIIILIEQSGTAKGASSLAITLGVSVIVAFFVIWGYIFSIRPYQKKIRLVDTLLRKVYAGEPLGDIADLLKKK